ncbi:MAG: AMP-binding protein [Eubacteriales bacterium]|nr:AMP-binding protein [Eubacteriales bacterium]
MKHIYDYLAEYAVKNPQKAAISDENGTLTYAELNEKSSALALRLAELKIRQGEPVAVYVPYVKELVVGTFAVMRAGAVYLPLEYSYPDDRLQFMLKDSSAGALLTLRSLWKERPLDFPEERVIYIDDEYGSVPSVSADVSPDAPAMILYTSGTTGCPKGVILPHTMMVSLMNWAFIHEGTELTEDSRAGIMSGLTFSATTLILYSPFMYGGTVLLAPEAARKDIDLLYVFLKENKITHTFLPAGLATTMAEHYDMSGINIFAGGEKLRNFRPLSRNTKLINTYGCTELGAIISAVIHGDEGIIPVGYLSRDTEAMITDENLCPVKIGETGELLVHNARMARSYLGLPEQTKAKWVDISGVTWYRTGDRARCTEDGLFYILGRTDNMVKIRGFRVETGEVEAQIGKAAVKLGITIRNIVVVVRNVNGIDHLTCYYESSDEADKNQLTEEISGALAAYMVPDIWVRMDVMPRNANGKIMRAQLPEPESCASAPGTVFNEAEARIVEATASVLGIKHYISPDDGFAQLGGTSLKAMELSTCLRSIGITVSSAQILRLNTLREIASEAEVAYEKFWTDEEYRRIREDFSSRGEEIKEVLPITPEQDEALFEMMIHPDQRGSRHVFMFQMDSLLTENELRDTLDTVSAAFKQLRSAIVYHKVTVFQQVITDRTIPLRIITLPEENRGGLKDIYHLLMTKYCDLQRESSVQAVCAHIGQESFLFILDLMADINMPSARRYIARIMDILSSHHPEDVSVAAWKEIFELNLGEQRNLLKERAGEKILRTSKSRRQTEKDIHVYSENAGRKIVFVHTGNTGSEAYYSLAARIGNDFSFSVIEPFNLYHLEEATYGISNIASRYVGTLLKHQPEGPYILGGWCYGGIVAQEMACQLQAAGKEVELLILLDSHVITDEETRRVAEIMHSGTDRSYFETCDLFEEQRAHGMLEALVENSRHVGQDMMTHVPSYYNGRCLYFKPEVIPAGAVGKKQDYWQIMTSEYDAGGYESFCAPEKLTVVDTPHEHDLMMDSESLDIIVPHIVAAITQNSPYPAAQKI